MYEIFQIIVAHTQPTYFEWWEGHGELTYGGKQFFFENDWQVRSPESSTEINKNNTALAVLDALEFMKEETSA